MNQNMNDFDNSIHLGFVRSNLIGWNHPNQEISQDVSQVNRIRQNTNTFFYMTLPNQPPRPGNNLYSCIQSENSEESVIKQVPFRATDVQNKMVKQVNSKQYFRMMKRRIKKGMQKILKGENTQQKEKKKYLHESRHKHAATRLRGKDGKFLATRSPQQRFREKKKRGRKPKNAKITDTPQTSTKANQLTKHQLTPVKAINI